MHASNLKSYKSYLQTANFPGSFFFVFFYGDLIRYIPLSEYCVV